MHFFQNRHLIPSNWCGQLEVVANSWSSETGVAPAKVLGVKPSFWSVYAIGDDGLASWLADHESPRAAKAAAWRIIRSAERCGVIKRRRFGRDVRRVILV